ncbi:hypothetical protein GDO78_000843 [Eleutherodactylus coqui]|uniref:Uncharacterized protein n=1 Tax=Eleutherodactylus coqui TaxID=57060 RepID=A0A8J6FQB5_ELECQ|nr:hypothetical protein GDO78_000843 [Eleutherodactylus coqui]
MFNQSVISCSSASYGIRMPGADSRLQHQHFMQLTHCQSLEGECSFPSHVCRNIACTYTALALCFQHRWSLNYLSSIPMHCETNGMQHPVQASCVVSHPLCC